MDLPVRDQQQYLVDDGVKTGLDVTLKLGQERCKIGRAAKVNLGQRLSIKVDNARNTTVDFGLVVVSIEWEAVAQLFTQKCGLSTKSKHSKHLIEIVCL